MKRMPLLSKTDLLARSIQAEPAALTVLYDQYVNKIYAYIYHRVGQTELAEDLTGQAVMRVLGRDPLRPPWRTSFSGWV